MKRVLVGVAAVAVLLVGCSGKPEYKRVGRDFSSLQQCVRFIEADIAKALPGEQLSIVTDTPTEVSGLSKPNRMFFTCEIQKTGTRGTVLQGRWDQPV